MESNEECGCEPAEMAMELQAVLAAVAYMNGGALAVPADMMTFVAGMKFSLDLDEDGGAVIRVKRAASVSVEQALPDWTHDAPMVLQ